MLTNALRGTTRCSLRPSKVGGSEMPRHVIHHHNCSNENRTPSIDQATKFRYGKDSLVNIEGLVSQSEELSRRSIKQLVSSSTLQTQRVNLFFHNPLEQDNQTRQSGVMIY